MPNFSIVLIAKNEEKTLPRLLNSLVDFRNRGGEIVLVDTGSTDKTAQIARENGCKVEEVGSRFVITITKEKADAINSYFLVNGEEDVVKEGQTLFDYSSARNFASTLASNDFIFTPDCDEIYTKFDIDELERQIQSGVEQFEYDFVFSHDAEGKPVIEFMHSKAYDRRKLKWVGIIHEVLSGVAKRQYLPSTIIKLEHFQNHETNRTGYLKGLAIDCFENPDNDRNSHYFGRELFWSGRYHTAIKELKRHVEMNRWQAERSQSAVFIGDCYEKLGDEDSAVMWWNKAYAIESSRREPVMRLAEFYWRKNDPKRAVAYAEMALTILQDGFYANNAHHYKESPHEILYWGYWQLGNTSKAKEHYDIAYGYCPKNDKFLAERHFFYPEEYPMISILLPTLGRLEGLKRAEESIKNLSYPKHKIELIVKDGEGTVPNKVDEMYKSSKGEWLVYASNDTVFTPSSIQEALKCAKLHKKRLVSFNTGIVLPDEGNICEHFIIHRSLANELGEIFSTKFRHVGVDNLLWAKAKKKNEAIRCDSAVVHHFHFSTQKSEFDSVYKKGWENAEADRALLRDELKKLDGIEP